MVRGRASWSVVYFKWVIVWPSIQIGFAANYLKDGKVVLRYQFLDFSLNIYFEVSVSPVLSVIQIKHFEGQITSVAQLIR